jgi:hypothetical protein
VPRVLAVPALASITAITALASDAEAAQRRATLETRVRVVGECDAATVAGSPVVALGAPCAASLNLPVTLVETRAATGSAAAAPSGAPIAGAIEADGVQYLTIIY